jgi:hypothetical protein
MGAHEKQTARRAEVLGTAATSEQAPAPELDDTSSRPTIVPPFDVGLFAREKMTEEEVPPGDRPTLPPPPAAAPPFSGVHERVDLDEGPVVTIDVEEPDARVVEAEPKASEEQDEATLVAQLGSLDCVLILGVDPATVYAKIDPRGAFLLAQIDGTSTVETLLDICGMPRHDALRLLVSFVKAGFLAVT